MKKIIAVVAFIVPAFSFAVTDSVACTADAKLCPDGVTYVGRVAPNCSFSLCPGETSPVPPICISLKSDLDIGENDEKSNGEVSILQNFLYPYYLKVKPTGNFYGLTRAAVAQFQKENGIFPSRGYMGALTRAKIKELVCGGTSQKPVIRSMDPNTARVGQKIVLKGEGLNSGGDYILFNGYRIETNATKASNQISFTVPEYLSQTIYCIKAPCPLGPVFPVIPGSYTVSVVNNKGTTNTVSLTVIDGTVIVPPVNDKISISFVTPRSAKVGELVVIYGYNLFRPETKILFDGVSISGTPVYDKSLGNFNSALEFRVPASLSSCKGVICTSIADRVVVPGTYELAVENKFGRDAVKFEVIGDVVIGGKPDISSLSPTQGIVGAEVYIIGTNINTGSEKIYFGGSQVVPTTLTTNRKGVISFRVPDAITPCGYGDGTVCRMMAQLVTPGKYDVVVTNKEGVSNALSFNVVAVSTNPKPEITSLTPSSGSVGTQVAITIEIGPEIMLALPQDIQIYFGGSLVPIEIATYPYPFTDTNLVKRKYDVDFLVPDSITPCGVGSSGLCKIASQVVVPGAYDVVVVDSRRGTSNALSFNVTSNVSNNPSISSITPAKGATGSSVTIYGQAISSATDFVWFGGIKITPDRSIKALNTLVFIVPTSLNQCSTKFCLDIAEQPTPLGYYNIKVETDKGLVSNIVSYQVTSNGSSATQ